ncbi:hypothetical protein RGQ29_028022 [Quercus rubra]|uniref:Uncharacterized protein n=1 Tax=Quercus rubra TaxID=3512 RepID=A0AAN7ERY1_QUERU|nr:hypothetical protein RGQ29_028022 [Quercus rubra]
MNPMEAVALCDHNNKENIPPSKHTNPVTVNVQSFKKSTKRRILRKPLADITNLFNNSAQLRADQESSNSLVPTCTTFASACASRSRKRKAIELEEIDPIQVTSSMSLRMGFR